MYVLNGTIYLRTGSLREHERNDLITRLCPVRFDTRAEFHGFDAFLYQIFVGDRHLGGYLNRKFGRDMLLWPGVCIVHEAFSETELLKLKARHPGAPVAAHPECPPHIVDHADYVGSTSGILQFAKTFPSDTLIVATEPHIIHQMELAIPEKTFIGAPGADGNCNCNICPYMALNTMEKLYLALRDLQPRIEMDEGLRLAAKRSLDRMLEMASGTVGMGDVGKPVVTGA